MKRSSVLRNAQRASVLLAVLLLALLLFSCEQGENYTIGLEIVTPTDQDVLAGVSELTLTLRHTTKDKSKTLTVPVKADGSIDLGFGNLPDWTEFDITAQAVGDNGDLFGKTMPIAPSRDAGLSFGLYLGLPGTIATAPLNLEYDRAGLVAVMLNNYDMLLLGGEERDASGEAESTPASIEWFNGGSWLLGELSVNGTSLSTPKGMVGHDVTAAGAVRAVFGFGKNRLGDSEAWEELYLFDATNSTSPLSVLTLPSGTADRTEVAMTALADGSMVLVGGGRAEDGTLLDDLLLIEAESATVRALGTMKTPRGGHRFVPLARTGTDGESVFQGVLVIGGNEEGEALSLLRFSGLDQGLDRVSVSEESVSSDVPPLRDFAVASLGEGRVLLAGGMTAQGPSAATWLFQLSQSGEPRVTRLADLPVAVSRLSGVAVSETVGLFCGGLLADGTASDACALLGVDYAYSEGGRKSFRKAEADGDLDGDTEEATEEDGDADELPSDGDDENDESDTQALRLKTPRADFAMERIGDGIVLILGGWNEQKGGLRTIETYTPPIDWRR